MKTESALAFRHGGCSFIPRFLVLGFINPVKHKPIFTSDAKTHSLRIVKIAGRNVAAANGWHKRKL